MKNQKNPQNKSSMKELIEVLLQIGFMLLVGLGYCYYIETDEKAKFDKRMQTLYFSAQQGNSESQLSLANSYSKGTNLFFTKSYGKDIQQANYWYEISALQGNLQAQYYLANNLEKGEGVAKSYNNALYWYLQSANRGYSPSIYKLGTIYEEGLLGLPKNKEIALSYFKKIENETGVGDINGKISKIELAISAEKSLSQPNVNSSYSNSYYQYPNTSYYGGVQQIVGGCSDGSISKNIGKQGACSHHGGVRH